MRKFLVPAVVVAALAGGTAVAMADNSSEKVAAVGSVSMEQVTSKLQAQGLTIKKIKLDDGRYKVKAIDASGKKEKLYVSAATGDVVAKGNDDDDD